jgi:hypothetical protein
MFVVLTLICCRCSVSFSVSHPRAFSVAETVESQWCIRNNASNIDLSPQQIVDCDWGGS